MSSSKKSKLKRALSRGAMIGIVVVVIIVIAVGVFRRSLWKHFYNFSEYYIVNIQHRAAIYERAVFNVIVIKPVEQQYAIDFVVKLIIFVIESDDFFQFC